MATEEKIAKAILELLIGKANGVSDNNGTTIPSGQNNDKLAGFYNTETSLPKHLVSKEQIELFPLEGMQQTIDPDVDVTTQMPIFNITTDNQEAFNLQESRPEGGVENIELDEIDAGRVIPTDYFRNRMLQSLLNSISVSVANSVAKAITNIIVAKIENNFTEFTIKFDPETSWLFTELQATGAIIPGQAGQLVQLTGQLKFNDAEYVHKCKIKFSDL